MRLPDSLSGPQFCWVLKAVVPSYLFLFFLITTVILFRNSPRSVVFVRSLLLFFERISQSFTMHFSSAIAASAVFALASGAVMGKRALSGQATFYGGNLHGGTCSFSTYTLPSSIFGTALSDSNWDDAAECGACITVTGPAGNNITAMVLSLLPLSFPKDS
jgi:hypothetical protein